MNFFNPFRMVTGMHSGCLPPEGRRSLVFCVVIFIEKIILYFIFILSSKSYNIQKAVLNMKYIRMFNGVLVSLKTCDSV
jgi:hypothetical protein